MNEWQILCEEGVKNRFLFTKRNDFVFTEE